MMTEGRGVTPQEQRRALWLSTIAFTVCFAVWTIFAIIGIRIKEELGLNETQFGLLVGTPILTGSLIRLALGIWTDQYGGRIVYTLTMLAAAVATFLLVLRAHLSADAARGARRRHRGRLVRGRHRLRVALVSDREAGHRARHFRRRQCRRGGHQVPRALRAGRLRLAGRPRRSGRSASRSWASIFWFTTKDDPVLRERRARGEKPTSAWLELEPLKNIQVWRFSLYYFFVFGAFVALSLWLPRYLINVYGVDIKTAGMMAALFSFPASVFRAYGGHLSDRYGARRVMYWTFLVAVVVHLRAVLSADRLRRARHQRPDRLPHGNGRRAASP